MRTPAGAAPGYRAGSARGDTCELGSYLTDVYNLDPAGGTFSARFWLWSLCPRKDIDPLPLAAFTNGENPQVSESQQGYTKGYYRHLILVQGQFRQPFDMRDYPFNRQTLQIVITAAPVVSEFRFTPDSADSSFNPQAGVPGWRVTGFRVVATVARFHTNFGILTQPPGTVSTRSRIVLEISTVNSQPTIFGQFVGPLLVIFLVTLLTFFMRESTETAFMGRIVVESTALFATILNMERVAGFIPDTSRLTMLDLLHLITLAYVLFAMGITVLGYRMFVSEREADAIARVNRIGLITGVIGYAAAVTVVVTQAALAG